MVDVKPLYRVSKTQVAFTFGWTRRTVDSRGWHYEVWSEPPSAKLENIRFLAGYRRLRTFPSRSALSKNGWATMWRTEGSKSAKRRRANSSRDS